MTPDIPVWLKEARASYSGYNGKQPYSIPVKNTSITRAKNTMDAVERDGFAKNLAKPNILIAGAGLNSNTQCAYVPFMLAAHFEGRGQDYQMTIVDISATVIEAIAKGLHVSVLNRTLEEPDYEPIWKKYLADTHQTDVQVEQERLPRKREALVPQTFRDKLANDDITLINGDIALTELGVEQFDYVDCMNLLYQLPEAGQKLAVANMSRALKVGGLMLLNDVSGGIGGIPTFKTRRGWLDKDVALDLGLQEVGPQIAKPIESLHQLYVKTNPTLV